MEYRRMGRSGLKVSEICLGTMTFGHGGQIADSLQAAGWRLPEAARRDAAIKRGR